MKKAMLFDAVGMIDADLLESYALMDQRLRSRRRVSKTKKYLVTLLAAAVAMLLIFALLITSVPLIYVFNAEEINTAVSETVENVLFPLDKEQDGESGEINREDLLINWVEWKFTEEFFTALGAGTEDSVIDKMQSMPDNGLVGESMQGLGDFLKRLYEYYLEHKDELHGEHGNNGTEQPDTPDATVHLNGCTYIYNTYWNYYELQSVDYISKDSQGTLHIPDEIEGIPVGEISRDACRNNKDLKKLIMPDSIDSIGIDAFSGCENLAEITFSNQLKSIGETAFGSCHALTSLDLPDSINSLGENVFANCQGLEYVSLSDGLEKISKSCFGGCTSLVRVDMGASVTVIEESAFASCSSLESVELPQSLRNIEQFAFQRTGLKDVVLPYGTSVIEHYAFAYCSQLQSVTLPETLTKIGDSAFSETALLQVKIPDCILELGTSAFDTVKYVEYEDTMMMWCSDIWRSGDFVFAEEATVKCSDGECYADYTSQLTCTHLGIQENGMIGYAVAYSIEYATDKCIIVPPYFGFDYIAGVDLGTFFGNEYLEKFYMADIMEFIDAVAFTDCTALQYVKLSSSLKTMKERCFAGCTALQSISIPASVTKIETLAFDGCTLLTTVEYQGTVSQWQQIDLAGDAFDPGVTIVCTDGEIIIE